MTERRRATAAAPPVQPWPPEVEAAPLDIPGRGWLARWIRRNQEAISETDRNTLLHLIREQHLPAYRYLIKTDPVAAGIKVRRGWVESAAEEGPHGGYTEASVRRTVATIQVPQDGGRAAPFTGRLLRLLRAALSAQAPHLLALVPEEPPGGERAAARPAEAPLPEAAE